jgi:nucleotide-binding universal stress UspA family protein
MKEIRRILVPVDFSDSSRRALDEAIEWARVFGAELHLLHCFQFLPGAIENYGVEIHESFDDVRHAALRCLAEWCDKVRAAGIPVQQHFASKLPAEETAALAEKLGAELIVIGTRGLTGLEHVMLGSVTERTLRLAPCPVLTVRHGEAS